SNIDTAASRVTVKGSLGSLTLQLDASDSMALSTAPDGTGGTNLTVFAGHDDSRNFYTDTNLPLGLASTGTSVSGRIDYAGDKDIFQISLTLGRTYTFYLDGTRFGGNTLVDPYLRLLDTFGNVL